jgi:hypothetical protein
MREPAKFRYACREIFPYPVAGTEFTPQQVTFTAKRLLCRLLRRFALVAQLDRASDFESEGREFESLRARQDFNDLTRAANALGSL